MPPTSRRRPERDKPTQFDDGIQSTGLLSSLFPLAQLISSSNRVFVREGSCRYCIIPDRQSHRRARDFHCEEVSLGL